MRKVKFKIYIKPVYYNLGESTNLIKEGTGIWTDFTNEGYFHQWGAAYEEFENGPGNYTVAIVECLDGSIVEVHPTHIIFVSHII